MKTFFLFWFVGVLGFLFCFVFCDLFVWFGFESRLFLTSSHNID